MGGVAAAGAPFESATVGDDPDTVIDERGVATVLPIDSERIAADVAALRPSDWLRDVELLRPRFAAAPGGELVEVEELASSRNLELTEAMQKWAARGIRPLKKRDDDEIEAAASEGGPPAGKTQADFRRSCPACPCC